VELYFSPSDGTNSFLLSTLQSATQNMFFATMLITRSDLANAISGEVNTGVTVQGLIDDAATSTQYGNLSGSMGSNLHVNADTTVYMHHKYLVVDHGVSGADTKVWVGSHNWSTNANARNDENSLIIHDATIANWFYQEFTKRLTDTLGSSVITALGGGDAWEVRLHPNPAKLSEGFWLNVQDRAGAQAKLFTLEGRLLGTQTLLEGMNRVSAPLLGLNPGMYLLEITAGGKRGMQRITLTE
jgi:phosphatidylserine/phosphatidylglycerophosphate/cardiolipin synthase-like enzyme